MIWTALLLACGAPDGAALTERAPRGASGYDLTLSLEGYSVYDGLTASVSLLDRETLEPIWSDDVEIVDGGFLFEAPGVLAPGEAAILDYYVDKNGDGGCDYNDGVWRVRLDPVEADVAIARSFGDGVDLDRDGCLSFPAGDAGIYDLRWIGAGYTSHNGQTVYINVVRDSDGSVAATGSQEVADTSTRFFFPGALQAGVSYSVDWFVDINEDGACTSNDHAWSRSIGSASDHVVWRQGHPTLSEGFNHDEACDQF